MPQQTYRIEPGTEAAKDLFYSGNEREQHCVGHLRGDFGEDGGEFWTSFWPHDGIHLVGDDFSNDLNTLVRILRKNLLRSRRHMQRFIQQHPPLTLESGAVMAYGYQVIADRYEYYVRCTPQPGCYTCGKRRRSSADSGATTTRRSELEDTMNVYEIVTDRIIAELQSGVIPWERPWTGVRDGAYSRATGKPYSLLNQMLLGKPGEYLTYRQAQEAGGQVRKGEKGSIVVFWKLNKVAEKGDGGELRVNAFPVLKYYHVFRTDQCDGIEPKHKEPVFRPLNPIVEAEAVLNDYSTRCGVPIIHEKGNRAYYSPGRDEIHLPLMEQFTKQAEYYSTAFHESIHSTGHEKRLNRLDKTARFGNETYSKEELVAEMGAAMILHELGIETDTSFRNNAAYVQNWLHVLKDDPRMVVSAAGRAEKAVKLILNLEENSESAAA